MIRLSNPTSDRVVYRLASLLLTRGRIARAAWFVLTWPFFLADAFASNRRDAGKLA